MQEIPKSFSARSGWPGHLDVTLVTSITREKQWPLQLRRVEPGSSLTAISIGSGWDEFVKDNGVGLGDLLVFEVVDEVCLVVTIHRHRPRPATHGKKKPPAEMAPTPKPARTPTAVERTGSSAQAPPSAYKPFWGPQFCKTLRVSHLRSGGAARLVSLPPLLNRMFSPVSDVYCS